MVPQYVRQVAPRYTAPGGQTAVANVGVGNAVSQLGAGIRQAAERKLAREDALAVNRAWRDIEQWQLDYLSGISERREQLSRTQVDPETGNTVTGYQVEIEAFGTKLDERYAQASANLSTRAKEELEKRFNAHAPTYGRYTADTLSTLELEDITAEIKDLAKTDRVADANELFELYSDRYSPADRQKIQATIEAAAVEARLAGARTYLQNTASAQGWDAAVALIDDAKWQQAMGLDIADAATIHNVLSTFARIQEGKEQRAAAVEAEQARNSLFADAMGDKLTDPGQIDQALRAGVLSPTEAKQLYELMKKGPPAQNDPDVFREAVQRVKSAQADPAKTDDVVKWLRGHTTSLRPTTYESFVNQLYQPDSPLNQPAVKMLNGLIDESYDQGAFGDWGTLDAQMAYARTKQAFIRYSEANPEASDEELNAEYRRLVEPEAKPRWYARIREVFLRTGTGLANLYGEPVGVEPITFEQADASRPPETVAEFERVLMSLPPGSKAQEDYYRRWADRWR